MVLEGYLYVGSSLCSLCEFNIFDVRAVFIMDACRLFPQCVLVIIPLIGGVQVQWLVPSLGVLGSGRQLRHAPGTRYACGHGLQPLLESGREVAGARDHPWHPGGQCQWPETAPRVWEGGGRGLPLPLEPVQPESSSL